MISNTIAECEDGSAKSVVSLRHMIFGLITMIDILFTPTNPISACYHVTAQTILGHAWLDCYCISRMAYSQRDIRQLTARLDAMGLSFRVDWAFAREALTMERSNA